MAFLFIKNLLDFVFFRITSYFLKFNRKNKHFIEFGR